MSDNWAFDDGFSPIVLIPTAVNPPGYHSSAKVFVETSLDTRRIVEWLGTEMIKGLIGKVFVGRLG